MDPLSGITPSSFQKPVDGGASTTSLPDVKDIKIPEGVQKGGITGKIDNPHLDTPAMKEFCNETAAAGFMGAASAWMEKGDEAAKTQFTAYKAAITSIETLYGQITKTEKGL